MGSDELSLSLSDESIGDPEIEYKFESDDNGFIVGFNRVKTDITNVVKGINTLKFNLEDGIYNNAKIYIKNDIGNITELEISEFIVNSKELKPDFEYVQNDRIYLNCH